MENKFKVLKQAIIIPTLMLFVGIMYIFKSPVAWAGQQNYKNVNITAGTTTREQIFKELGNPLIDSAKDKTVIYNVTPQVKIVINYTKPYKNAKKATEKVKSFMICFTGTRALCWSNVKISGKFLLSSKARTISVASVETILGRRYYLGKGEPRSFSRAAYWWKKAAARGNTTAKYNLKVLKHNLRVWKRR